MYRTAVVVADEVRARLFFFGRARDPTGPHERLAEVASLDARAKPASLRDFARSIDGWIEELLDEAGISRLMLCATPRMLGALRAVLRPRHDVIVEELVRGWSSLTTGEIAEELAESRRPVPAAG